MEHDAGKRQRGNSITTTPERPTNNDGRAIPEAQVTERPQESGEINSHDPQGYDLQSSNTFTANSSSPPTNPAPRYPFERSTTSSSQEGSSTSKRSLQTVAKSSLEPPVTKSTLSELDVNKIVHNPKLRHDINFDPDLHFRPNLDGEKGRKKTQKANDFWDTMRLQLQGYLTDREQFEKDLGDAEWCLPATLKAIRGILETLVPQRDRSSVEETFNVDLLMQQFRKGVADLGKLARWLSQLLKCHCAPMRDTWVDDMVVQLSEGDKNWDVSMLVSGMRNLLGVLEAMKLDVANHQIRCLRPLLIEDTVQFEQKFFVRKIAMGRVDIASAHDWFKKAASLPDNLHMDAPTRIQGNTWDFMKALVNLTLPSKAIEPVPHTFLFDEERLVKLRADMLDLINLEICMFLYHKLDAASKMNEARSVPQDDTPVASSYISSPADEGVLSAPTVPSENDFKAKRKYNHLAQERGHFSRELSGRQVWVPNLEEEATDSPSSSPRSSPSTTASTPETYPVTPLYLSLQNSDSTSQVRTSLQALLASSSSQDRWTVLSSNIALQILRSTPTPMARLPVFESHLSFHLSNSRSKLYQEAEARVLSKLFPELQKLVESYTPLNSLQIFDAATSPRPANGIFNGNSPANGQKEEILDVATRIAHIGILHWRVWAPLAYLVNPDVEDEGDVNMMQDADIPVDES
ncbi:4022ad38-f812-46ac-9e6c-9efa91229c44 [Sclerotinia trifoliorum]|uniref:4022ad38-f812-46ac-9e6c-9efa91229c44 n=1 Tax=Sclerotinia trifoliorum TaxID=28548 RepID=A0A8H2ZSV8_9HELO|nr:4022ad38-f812-46ac-9e6c-9efa91229c44 [Sclerotinia trifoliorum]